MTPTETLSRVSTLLRSLRLTPAPISSVAGGALLVQLGAHGDDQAPSILLLRFTDG
jgi:hypothetical protein